jgi:hypothetical protein
LDCGSLLPLSRSQPAGPAPFKLSAPPNQPAEGSGLLGESQLSLRAEHAYPPSPNQPGRRPLDCGSLLPLSRSQPAGPAPFKSLPKSPRPLGTTGDQPGVTRASRGTPGSQHNTTGPRRGPPLRTSAPKALDSSEHHNSPCARSTPTRPLPTSPAEGPWTAEACCRFPGASPLARHHSSSPPHPPPRPRHHRIATPQTPQPHSTPDPENRHQTIHPGFDRMPCIQFTPLESFEQ